MRVALSLAVLALAGCANNSKSLDADDQDARRLLAAEQYPQALSGAEDGLRRAGRNAPSKTAWRFRLLKAEILLAERDGSAAAALLREDPPAGAEWDEDRGRVFLLRGRAAFYLAHYAEARDWTDRAAELAHQSGSAALTAEVELRQALLLARESKFSEAETLLRQSIRDAAALGDSYLEATAIGNFGYTLLTAARYDEAIVWFEKAAALHRRLGARESLARDDGNLGNCYYRLGDYEQAQQHYDQARAGFRQTGNRFEEQVWTGNAANVQFETGQYAAAAAAYRNALDIARQVPNLDWAARWLNNLAATSVELRDWDAAGRYNREALDLKRQLGDSRYQTSSLYNAGRIAQGRGQLDEAERLLRSAVQAPAEDPSVMLDAHASLADLYAASRRTAQAEAEFRAAVAALERLDAGLIKDDYRFSYLASLIRFYRRYVDFLMAEGRPDRALEVAESSRSRVLAQRDGRAEPVRPHTVADYQKLARQARSVLLEYWLGDRQSYLWAVTPGEIRHYSLPPAGDLQPWIERYRGVILRGRDPLQVAAESGRKLYDLLLAPAASLLSADCRVLVVPDGELYSLNVASLPDGARPGRYWIERATVTIAPSLDYLADAALRRPGASGKGLLLLGDAVPALPEFPKLEFAAREIDSIGAILRPAPEDILRGGDARPGAYAAAQPGRFGYIHFSAHAAANPQSPLDSAVILSGPPDQCKLFARDVMAIPLSAELVTISACRSAGAKTYAGEGLVGFAWAFLRAGARHVIAGLWDVNDRSTLELMAGLYEGLARGSAPADALRTAQLALIRGGGAYAKPFYWAPFELYASVP